MSEVSVQNKDIEKRVIKVVAETLGMELKEITRETSFETLDSLGQTELLMELEEEFEEFKIEISNEEAEKIKNVGQAIELISTLIETKARGS